MGPAELVLVGEAEGGGLVDDLPDPDFPVLVEEASEFFEYFSLGVRPPDPFPAPVLPGAVGAIDDVEPPNPIGGGGEVYNNIKDRTYAGSALATGSPSFTNERNRLFRSCGRSGFVKGNKLTGGVPNVTQ